MPLGIGALPTARGLPIGVGVATLKALPIFARRSAFAGRGRGRAIQHALALEAQQFVERQSLGGQQKGRATVPAIGGHDGTAAEQRCQLAQLGCSHLHAGLLRRDALLIQHPGPTAGLLRQQHDGRELPAIADGLATFGQVGHVDHRAIGRGARLGALDTGSIDAQPHLFSGDRPQQILHKHPAQALLVNASVCKGFIQTTPAPLKVGRERQLGKRLGLRLGQQRIHGIEQGISCSLKTVVDLVTKLLQCVKVHLSNAPFSKVSEHYSLGHSFVKRTAQLSKLV